VPVTSGDEPPVPVSTTAQDPAPATSASAPGPSAVASPRTAEAATANPRNAVSTTAQFTFKIANSAKPGMSKWTVAAIVGVIVVLVGGAAAVFVFLSK
jgi:hypothetical protein